MNHTLIACRKELGWTQTDMAKVIGISLDSYYRKETGQIQFKQYEMQSIMEILKDLDENLTIEIVFFNKLY